MNLIVMPFQYFIGVDVSKNSLDFVVRTHNQTLFHSKTSNNQNGIKSFLQKCKNQNVNIKSSLLCMEYTGIYNNFILQIVSQKNINAWLEHGRQIKQSMGITRGKNDKVDAARIAEYAARFQDKATLWKPDRKPLQILKQLVITRRRFINAKNQLKTPLKESEKWLPPEVGKQARQLSLAPIKTLEQHIKLIEVKIKNLIKQDPQLNHLFTLATSVTGVGPNLAHELILTTKEFTAIKHAKQYASYSGVAPFENQSGTSLKTPRRVSQMANKSTKKLLHMAALSVISKEGEMNNFYRRKVEQGKNKMLVINAVRNKIIHRVFACIRKNEKYDENYTYNLA